MPEQKKVLEDAKNLLEYAKTLGMTEIPASKAAFKATRAPKPPDQKTCAPEDEQKLSDAKTLEDVSCAMGDCQRCKLGATRTKLVFGVGNPKAEIMFIGEAPGRDEDEQGEPFVGRAGQLLTKIIQAMGFERKDVYIGNICKCRPPENRPPEPDEVSACIPFLIRQVELVKPKMIVCLGSTAVQNLLQTEAKISGMRGKIQNWRGVPVMPTYHPAFLLRNPAMKKPVWEDMQAVLKHLGKPVPEMK